ncbi:MAG: Druantia anti-phage system protein DruA [Methylococcales bacterium]
MSAETFCSTCRNQPGWSCPPCVRAGGAATAIPRTPQGDAPAPLDCALGWVQPVRLKAIEQPAEQRWWWEVVEGVHYLGYRTAYGASLRYLIEASCRPPTILGCLQFSSPAWRIMARDRGR